LSTFRAVLELKVERPEWIPVLQAACAVARDHEQYGGEFAGAWVLWKLQEVTGRPQWRPGLRTLVAYGLIEKTDSARGGRRAYYRMRDRPGVESALQELEERDRQPGTNEAASPMPTERLT
jgi:hypothetical protein